MKQISFEQLKTENILFDPGYKQGESVDLSLFYDYYSLRFKNTRNCFGYFFSKGIKIAAYGFIPEVYTDTAVVLHGYFNHTGLLDQAIGFLTKKGCAVFTIDLPGHGLSGGERAGVDDFDDYSHALLSLLDIVKPHIKGELFGIGHSTGCAVLTSCVDNNALSFSKLIFCAPLIRIVMFFPALISHMITAKSAKSIPRLFRKTSSNEDFMNFLKNNDPLQAKYMSTSWIESYFQWYLKMETNREKRIRTKLLVIQGDKDSVVGWKYNLPFLKEKFVDSEIYMVKKARHELLKEKQKYLDQVFYKMQEFLGLGGI